jgi:hypothetical protein
MLNNDYFTEAYQNNLERFKTESLEEYISLYEKTYRRLRDEKPLYLKTLLNNNHDTSDEEENKLFNQAESIIEDYESISSGYTTVLSEEFKEETFEQEMSESNFIADDFGYDSLLNSERFKNLKINKNQLTIRPRSKEEIKEYQRQETERYKHPHLPWEYKNPDGSSSIVSPVVKKALPATTSKPRDHILLKPDRPPYVTILCLARDAAARLQDGVGTRADICDLLKDSQYVNERLLDSQINNIVSGALDRLHYEKDPCVKYDLQKKLWIYLHKNRAPDHPGWTVTKIEGTDLELKEDDEDEHSISSKDLFNLDKKPKIKSKKTNLLKMKRKHSD